MLVNEMHPALPRIGADLLAALDEASVLEIIERQYGFILASKASRMWLMRALSLSLHPFPDASTLAHPRGTPLLNFPPGAAPAEGEKGWP